MNPAVAEAQLAPGALLERYRTQGGHTDCYVAEVSRSVDLGQFITAFYTSRAFRPERWLLGALLGKRADDSDVAKLASGQTTRFSAWSVEDRRGDEILLCDFQSRTRSWLKVLPIEGGTRLHFGSAVVSSETRADRLVFGALLGFHRWYSRTLLRSAVNNL